MSTILAKPFIFPVLLLATIGQMTAKVFLFLSGMVILNLSSKRYENKIDETMTKMHRWGSKIDVFIFLSAFTGFPPFYIITIVAGILRHNFIRFFISGFTGRLLRFGLIILIPQFFRQLF